MVDIQSQTSTWNHRTCGRVPERIMTMRSCLTLPESHMQARQAAGARPSRTLDSKACMQLKRLLLAWRVSSGLVSPF